MGMNFNIVQKPKKTDEDLDEDELMDENELEVEETTKSTSFDPKKKMVKFMGIIMVGTLILLFFLFLISLIGGHKTKYSYSEIEKIMKDAAVSYFKDHPDYLPQDEGSIIEVDSSNLIAEEKMKDLSEYLDEGVQCTGTVQVEKAGTDYLYTPYLNCGDSYATIELYKKIVSDDNIVTTGYGLYSSNGGYVFRGENVNNYVKLGKSLWRIVKVTANDNIVLVSAEGAGYSQPWDDRYNNDSGYESGINQYSASRIKEFLERIYTNPDKDEGEDVLSKADKTKIIPYNVCTGKRKSNSEKKDNSEECAELLKDQKLGVLTLSDYMNASIDPNCKSADTVSCKNYNYLVISDDWWLATANKDDSYNVYVVNRSGIIKKVDASNYAAVRPVIYLNSKVLYKSGKGTKEKPYKVR